MACERTNKGRFAELISESLLLSKGWVVLEPITPEAFDFAIMLPNSSRIRKAQVKTARIRYKNDIPYAVVKGAKNSGDIYTKEEADFFVGMVNGHIFTLENREISEYWVKLDEIHEKWTTLGGVNNGENTICEM